MTILKKITITVLLLLMILTVPGCATKQAPDKSRRDTPVQQDSSFRIHFIDVGQADAALIECDGHWMLIDGGNREDSDKIYALLKENQVPGLDIVVATHAHEDHIGGLSGALNYTTSDLTLCPVTEYDSKAFDNFKKYADLNGGGITVPQVNDQYPLGSALVTILGVNSAPDTNNTSIVLRMDYGNTSFLFTGDAEREAEQVILASGLDLSATVLKVGHHGSDTSTTYPFLREVMPDYAVISCGKGNSYGHPTENTLSRLRDADVQVFRTDMQGEIYCESDGETVTFTVEKNRDADTLSNPGSTQQPEKTVEKQTEPQEQGNYVLNNKSRIFHLPSCSSVETIAENNKEIFNGDRKELISRGYQPCKRCNP